MLLEMVRDNVDCWFDNDEIVDWIKSNESKESKGSKGEEMSMLCNGVIGGWFNESF